MKFLISLNVLFILITSNVQAKVFELMSYNVENLFDAKHDEGKIDWSFLPKDTPGKSEACAKERSKYRRNECYDADWTQEKVDIKISQIVDVLTKERATTPELLALIEVENPEVVGLLAKKLGYDSLEMTNSPDNRGIDVALLFKSTSDVVKVSRQEHLVPVEYPSRNILEVEFLVGGKFPLTVFVNHWPSLANPDSWRIKAAEILANRAKDIVSKNPKMSIVAVGDFNTIDENNPHPFKTVLLKDNLFFDLSESFKNDSNVAEGSKKKQPLGSYYYAPKEQWNMLDRIFYNAALVDKSDLEIAVESFEIYLPSFALKELKISSSKRDDEKDLKIMMVPKRFESGEKTKEKMGFSDHFAVVAKFNYPDPAPVKDTKSKTKSKSKAKK